MITKTVDNKGRVTLGSQFAGQTVVIEDSNSDCVLIKPVVMIPAQEAWLYKNKTALGRLREGLDEAQLQVLPDSPPDVEADHEYDSSQNPYDKNKKIFEAYAQNKTPGGYCVFWCYALLGIR